MGMILFTMLFVPAFYVAVGFLSTSRYVNATATDLSISVNQSRAAGEGTASWADPAWRVAVVFAVMTAMLGAVALLAWLSNDIFAGLMLATDGFLIWGLIGLLTNPGLSMRRVVFGLGVAIFLMTARSLWPESWAWNGISSLAVVVTALLVFRTLRFRPLAILSAGLFAYDLAHVYGTGLMMRMVENAGESVSSLAMIIPASLSLGSEESYLMGHGDIVVPGVWAMLAFRMASAHRRPVVMATTLAGIVLGWAAAIATLEWTAHPVPALLFLVPGAALGYLASAIPLRVGERPPVHDS